MKRTKVAPERLDEREKLDERVNNELGSGRRRSDSRDMLVSTAISSQ